MKIYLIISELFIIVISLLDGLFKANIIKKEIITISSSIIMFLVMAFFQGYIKSTNNISDKVVIITDLVFAIQFMVICKINSLLFK